MRKLVLFLLMALFAASFALAQSSCLTVNSKNTKDYLNEISSINSQLGSCSITVPSQASSLISTGNILVTIAMGDGSTEQFYISIDNLKLVGITSGSTTSYSHEVRLSESTLDGVLSSTDVANAVLSGISAKTIVVVPRGVFAKLKWFFAKLFLPKPQPVVVQVEAGKPENCDDTYLPGHRNYAENKALWDSYSADSDNVCQSQYGKGIPSPCVYSVQLSIDGNPYYLCWYNY